MSALKTDAEAAAVEAAVLVSGYSTTWLIFRSSYISIQVNAVWAMSSMKWKRLLCSLKSSSDVVLIIPEKFDPTVFWANKAIKSCFPLYAATMLHEATFERNFSCTGRLLSK